MHQIPFYIFYFVETAYKVLRFVCLENPIKMEETSTSEMKHTCKLQLHHSLKLFIQFVHVVSEKKILIHIDIESHVNRDLV